MQSRLPKNYKQENVNISMDGALAEASKLYCEEKKISRSGLLAHLLSEHLDENAPELLAAAREVVFGKASRARRALPASALRRGSAPRM